MLTFKEFINEGFAYVKDPFREGNSIWVKKIHINGISVVQIVGSIDGIKNMHTAMVSVHTKSLDNFGEDLAREERFILHQKDFNIREEAVEYLLKLEKETNI